LFFGKPSIADIFHRRKISNTSIGVPVYRFRAHSTHFRYFPVLLNRRPRRNVRIYYGELQSDFDIHAFVSAMLARSAGSLAHVSAPSASRQCAL